MDMGTRRSLTLARARARATSERENMKINEREEACRERSAALFIICMVALLMTGGVGYAVDDQGMHQTENASTTANLDFSQVQFVVKAPPEFYQRLHARAIKKLRDAGIYKADPVAPRATLRLTLYPRPVDVRCQGKLLYEPSLALVEEVVTKRNPDMNIWADTWLLTKPAHLIDPMPIEKIESDLDEFLNQFIGAYKMGNRSKK